MFDFSKSKKEKIGGPVRTARAAEEAEKMRLETVRANLEKAQQDLKLWTAKARLANMDVDEALVKFSKGDIDERARDVVVEEAEQVRQKMRFFEKAVEAAEKAERECSTKLEILSIDRDAVEKVFFREVYAQLKQDIKEKYQPLFLKAHAALIMSGRQNVNSVKVFEAEFGGFYPDPAQMAGLRAEIESDFL